MAGPAQTRATLDALAGDVERLSVDRVAPTAATVAHRRLGERLWHAVVPVADLPNVPASSPGRSRTAAPRAVPDIPAPNSSPARTTGDADPDIRVAVRSAPPPVVRKPPLWERIAAVTAIGFAMLLMLLALLAGLAMAWPDTAARIDDSLAQVSLAAPPALPSRVVAADSGRVSVQSGCYTEPDAAVSDPFQCRVSRAQP